MSASTHAGVNRSVNMHCLIFTEIMEAASPSIPSLPCANAPSKCRQLIMRLLEYFHIFVCKVRLIAANSSC